MIPIPPGLSEVVQGWQGTLLAVSPCLSALHFFIKTLLSPAPWSTHPKSGRPSKPDGEQIRSIVTAIAVKQGKEAGREVPFQSTGKASPAPDRWELCPNFARCDQSLEVLLLGMLHPCMDSPA